MKRIIEAALLTSSEPVNIKGLSELFHEEDEINKEGIQQIITLLQEDYAGRGIELVEVSTGYRFQVCADLAPWLHRMREEKPGKYSRAVLETLSLIAYKQPITRGEIEEIRGVAVSTDIIRKLEEREWVRVIGHKDVPGKPALLATTSQFLDDLNLRSLAELPTLAELQDLDQADSKLNEQLNLNMEVEDQNQEPNVSTAEAVEDVEEFDESGSSSPVILSELEVEDSNESGSSRVFSMEIASDFAENTQDDGVVAEENTSPVSEAEESASPVILSELEVEDSSSPVILSELASVRIQDEESEDMEEFDMIPEPA